MPWQSTLSCPKTPVLSLCSNHEHSNIGYILHPSITFPPSPRIADMGTGTARFLLRLQPTYPDAKLEGFDISSTLFPSSLPDNVTLSEQDIKQPFPEHMHGKYDLVHVRMLVAAMLPGDWEPVVRNLTGLLKPGGYLQWEECDFVSTQWTSTTTGTNAEKSELMGDAFCAALGERLKYGWNTVCRYPVLIPAILFFQGFWNNLFQRKLMTNSPFLHTHSSQNTCEQPALRQYLLT